jgi:putative transposase
MKFDPQNNHLDEVPGSHRRSIRLPNYNYSQVGAYFVTIVTFQREYRFGEIQHGKMNLNNAGQIVWNVWNSLPERYPTVTLDTAVVMPNHFHGIVMIDEPVVGVIHELPLQDRAQRRRMTLPLVVGYFKMNSAKQINKLSNSSGVPIWQRNYYEHIIRNDEENNRVQFYIDSNIDNWAKDDENLHQPK